MADVGDQIFGMSGAAREVMQCLFFHGPTWDGNIPSKLGRGELFKLGYATRHQGWSYLTDMGTKFAIDSMVMGDAKEQYRRLHRVSEPSRPRNCSVRLGKRSEGRWGSSRERHIK